MASCTRALAAAGSIGALSNKNHGENKNLKKTNKNSFLGKGSMVIKNKDMKNIYAIRRGETDVKKMGT